MSQANNKFLLLLRSYPSSLKFGQNFKPVFSASDLVSYCNNPRQWNKTKLKFIRKFSPFSMVKLDFLPTKTLNLNAQDKSFINKSILKDSNNEIDELTNRLDKFNLNSNKTAVLDKTLKQDMLKQLNETLSLNNTSFNDSNVIESVLENSKEKIELEDKMNILMTNFLTPNAHQNNIDDNEDDNDYLTADSDVETFIKENDTIFNEKKKEMLNARRQQAKFYVSTRRGILVEKFVIENFNKEQNLNFVQDKQLKVVDFNDFKICGKIDGIDRERRIIIEIKTRNKISGKVNVKERKQALTYMKLMDCDQCWIVERGPKSDEENLIVIKWDKDEFENEIVNKLRIFCEYARNLSENQFIDLYKRFTKY